MLCTKMLPMRRKCKRIFTMFPLTHCSHRERAERRKLQRAIRQEERGAARELRRDAGACCGCWGLPHRPLEHSFPAARVHAAVVWQHQGTRRAEMLVLAQGCSFRSCVCWPEPIHMCPLPPSVLLQPSWRRRGTARRRPSRPSCLPRVRPVCYVPAAAWAVVVLQVICRPQLW